MNLSKFAELLSRKSWNSSPDLKDPRVPQTANEVLQHIKQEKYNVLWVVKLNIN